MIQRWNVSHVLSRLVQTAGIAVAAMMFPGCTPADSQPASFSEFDQQRAMFVDIHGAPPAAKITQVGEPLQWNSLVLSGSGQGTVAVSLKSPLTAPADLRFVFVVSSDQGHNQAIDWELVPAKDAELWHLRCFAEERDLNLRVPGEELGLRNRVFWQSLDDGQIKPGDDYVLWIHVKYGVAKSVYLAAQFSPQGRFPIPATADEVARDLGLAVPLQKNDLKKWDELNSTVSQGFRSRNAEMALGAAETLVEQFPVTRQNLLVAASLNISRGEQIRDRGESLDPNDYFLRAAAHMQHLREHFGNLKDGESPVFAEAMYFAAEAFASRSQKTEALAALRDAHMAGFPSEGVETINLSKIATEEEIRAIFATAAVSNSGDQ